MTNDNIGYLNSIETMGLVDGPGIRFVVFLQGCPLRCLFCHNPETWKKKSDFQVTPDQLLKRILKYKNYFHQTGGVTFSGGEPLMQPEFLLEVLKKCKENGIHTCLDTSGVGNGDYEELLSYVDLVLYDVKALSVEKYQEMTGNSIDASLQFLEACQKRSTKLWIRQVIIPGINDTEEYILKLKSYLSSIQNIEKIELLPYHTMGIEKYQELSLTYRLNGVPAMDPDQCKKLYELLTTEDKIP